MKKNLVLLNIETLSRTKSEIFIAIIVFQMIWRDFGASDPQSVYTYFYYLLKMREKENKYAKEMTLGKLLPIFPVTSQISMT